MAADAGSGDRIHIPNWSGNPSVMGSECENLNVKYSLAARLVFGLSGPARLTCMTMDAEQLHPPPLEGPVATAYEGRNIASLDYVTNVLQMSPLVKKTSCPQKEASSRLFPRRLFGKDERRADCHVARPIL